MRWKLSLFIAIAFLGSFCVLFSADAFAAGPPQTFGYQGTLTSSGAAVTGTKSVTFKIYDSLSAGSLLYTEAHPTVSVDSGFFSATIGETTPLAGIAFNQALFLEVVVEGVTLSPRQVINTVPFANVAYGALATSTAPTVTTGGLLYYDTTSGKLFVFDTISSSWIDLTATSSQVFSGFAGVGIHTNSNSQNLLLGAQTTTTNSKLEVNGDTSLLGTLSALGSTTLQNLTAVNATTTSATSTNLFVTNFTATNFVSSALGGFSNISTTGSTTLQNVTIQNATTSNATSTTLSILNTLSVAGNSLFNTFTTTGLGTLANLFVTGSSTLQDTSVANLATLGTLQASSTALFGQGITSFSSSTLQNTTAGKLRVLGLFEASSTAVFGQGVISSASSTLQDVTMQNATSTTLSILNTLSVAGNSLFNTFTTTGLGTLANLFVTGSSTLQDTSVANLATLGTLQASSTALFGQGFTAFSSSTLQNLTTVDTKVGGVFQASSTALVTGDFIVGGSRFVVQASTGRVGINTAAPSAPFVLDVNGDTRVSGTFSPSTLHLSSTCTGAGNALTTNGSGDVTCSAIGSGGTFLIVDNNWVYTPTTDTYTTATSTSRVSIGSGSAVPDAVLTVTSFRGASTTLVLVPASAPSQVGDIIAVQPAPNNFATSTVLTNVQRFGLGMGTGFKTPTAKLTVRSVDSGGNTETNAVAVVDHSNNEIFTVKESGNVGVGDSAPGALFTVGSGGAFKVTSGGTISAVTGISSTGSYTQSGASANTFTGATNFSAQATLSAAGTGLVVNNNATFGDAATDVALFTGTLQASSTALFSQGLTAFASSTLQNFVGQAANIFGVFQASSTSLFGQGFTTYASSTLQNVSSKNLRVNGVFEASSTALFGQGVIAFASSTLQQIHVGGPLLASSTAVFTQGILAYASSTLQNFTFGLATGTGITATRATSTNATSTTFATNVFAASGASTLANLLATGSTTLQNFSAVSGLFLGSTTLQNFTFNNATGTGLTVTNSTSTNSTTTNLIAVLGTGVSTFAGDVKVTGGVNIINGCYAVGGVCLGVGTVNTGITGQAAFYAGAGTTLTATSSLFFAPNQSVGVGTTSPGGQFAIAGKSGGTVPLFLVSSSTASFATTTNFIIDKNGFIGVNTIAPRAQLEVKAVTSSLGHSSGVPNNSVSTFVDPIVISSSFGNLSEAGISWAGNQAKPIARISMDQEGGGSSLNFGVSGNYSNGITLTPLQVIGTNAGESVILNVAGGNFNIENLSQGTAVNAICYNSGTGNITSSTAPDCSTSDVRLKHNFNYIATSSLDIIRQLRPVGFEYNEATGTTRVGFIAQDVAPFIPEAVLANQDGFLSLDYHAIAAHIVRALQEVATTTAFLSNRWASTTAPLITADTFGNLSFGTSSALTIGSDGNLAVGTTSDPLYKLKVGGDTAATGFINVSTAAAKTDIEHLTSQDENTILDKIGDVQVATYHYKTENSSNPLRLGLIAEEAPKDVLSVDGKGVDIYKLSTFAIAGIKAQQKEIEALQAQVGTAASSVASGEEMSQTTFFGKMVSAFRYVSNFFTKKVTTQQLCISDSETDTAPVCLNKAQLKAILESQPAAVQLGTSATSTGQSTSSTDTTPPVITLVGNNPATITQGSSYVDLGATVTDNIDASLGVTVTGDHVDTATIGTYQVRYNATDSAGNSAVEVVRTVEVVAQ